MLNLINRFAKDESGATAIEYGLIATLIAVAIITGATALGTQLNALFPFIPPGTLAANLLGGYLIGVAIAFFAAFPALAPEWRLLVITGFLGGLTTFSTFSAEVVSQIMEGRFTWAAGAVVVHVAGSLGMTLLGIGSVICFVSMLMASKVGEVEALRLHATELLMLLGTVIVLMVEPPAEKVVAVAETPAPVVPLSLQQPQLVDNR